MKSTIKVTNLKLTPEAKKAIKKKISLLEKFLPYQSSSIIISVEVARETKHHQKGNIYYAEINIKVPNKILRSEAREKTINMAVRQAKNDAQILLKKYKEKRMAKKRRGGRVIKRKTRLSSLIRTR